MKKVLSIVSLFSFLILSTAHADVKVSGFMQQIVGMGDEVDGGVTEKFTRFGFAADTTTDNGWTVGGSMAMEFSLLSSGAAYGPTSNQMYVQTGAATITVGNTANAASLLVPRIGVMVPGAGHDGGYQFLFDTGMLASHGVPLSEAYYAMSNSSITVQSPSINGFNVAGTYTPAMEFNSADGVARSANDESPDHGETAHLAISYSAEMDGISYTIGAATINGNSQSSSCRDDNTCNNNDLASMTAGLKVTMGNISFGAHVFDNQDSFGSAGDAVKAKHSGYTFASEYAMGSITVGAGYAHQELVRGTRAQARATTLTAADAGNVREDTLTYVGIGYNMGGGVNTYIQLNNMNHSDGDHATTEADPQVLFAGISLGF
ncbi:MAG: porin [Alphaproteobacteria bacterium]|tara:strand:+ start:1991 stop:3118 length:1128 start_codon:yes stop_codon:yes gene_type:complete